MKNLILSCDWGTSSFRLRLVDADSAQIVDEVLSQNGNAAIYKKWSEEKSADRVSFYLQYLAEAIATLSARSGVNLDRVEVIISGMASSSVGIKELPYAELPFSIDGSSAKVEWLSAPGIISNDILLISGVRHPGDVMRGEETQMIGIAHICPADTEEQVIYVFPGTHSKHVSVQDGMIIDFKTYITGEMFDVMTKHSVLAQCVSRQNNSQMNNREQIAFEAGLQRSGDTDLLNGLFSVRVNYLSNYFSTEENFYYLSGLLIGTELRNIRSKQNHKIVMCSGSSVHDFYLHALKTMGLMDRTLVIEPEQMNMAAVAGQMRILGKVKIKTD